MGRKKTTLYMDEDLLRSARLLAARTDRSEYDIVEDALRRYLGFHVLERVWERDDLPDEDAALELAYEELHSMRSEAQQLIWLEQRTQMG